MPSDTSAPPPAGNPLIAPPALPHGAPPLDLIKDEHYLPAVRYGIAQARADIAAIKQNPAAPNFANTIEALEFAGQDLSRIGAVFSTISSSNSNDEIRKIEPIIDSELSQYSSDVNLDPALFTRVKAVYDRRAKLKLSGEQTVLLENTYKGFVRSGALLPPAQQQRLRKIDNELSQRATTFKNNTVMAVAGYQKVIDDERELDGVPERAKNLYRQAATDAGMPGKFLIKLSPPPTDISSHCTNRTLREEIYRASASLCYQGTHDNTGVITDIVRLRHERAQLLGHASHAGFVLAERMAGDPKTVQDFLEKNLAVYKPVAEQELQRIRDFAKTKDGLADIKPWDTGYYSRLLQEQTFNLKLEEIRPYLDLEKVLDGLRQHAEKLFNIELREEKTGRYPVFHPDVKAYEVYDKKNGAMIAVFYADYYARPGAKRDGAWMNTYRSRGLHNGKDTIPLVINTCNFPKPTPTQPTFLSLREVTTVFHEFGHGLHAILAEARYPSLAGTNVKWDYVELPSQLQENWVLQKEVLDTFARHHKTGALIPPDLVKKIQDMQNFGAGMAGLRQTYLGLLDMAYHTTDPAQIKSPAALEKTIDARATLLDREVGLMSVGFNHIFSGGYSAGYYSYKWAEILDADVFSLFEKNGLYHRPTADRLRQHIYAKGGTSDEMKQFIAVVGRKPDPDAMFRREGLLPPPPGANDNTPKAKGSRPSKRGGKSHGPAPGNRSCG